MAKIITFDVNETLLDLRILDPLFEESSGASSMRPAVRPDAPALLRLVAANMDPQRVRRDSD